MNERDFVEQYGSVYEHSPWIATAAHGLRLTPEHDDPVALAGMMAAIVDGASKTQKLELLRAHPDLVGKLAQRGELTDESVEEQAGAGLDQCTPEEFVAFQDLNTRYTEKFGFPFIIAVRGYTRPEILEIFKARVDHDPEQEFAAALAQVDRIAALRIGQILAN
ncbi:MAG: 2-oxo-4-hydroxy-4-carboxy-5-ureidoimidazoline decarboxylase [Rhizobiales bacterium]|nr:2-oxo-4-hydroxy-4-carboxy-5-ureidoimidazoline decarboxylase [Hyphomicrobiales bacterium]